MKRMISLLLIPTTLIFILLAQPSRAQLAYKADGPFPIDLAKRDFVGECASLLDTLKARMPAVTYLSAGFDAQKSDTSDWKAILDLCHEKGYQVVVGFLDSLAPGDYQGYRPKKSGGRWQLGPLEKFVTNAKCIEHPALYALFSKERLQLMRFAASIAGYNRSRLRSNRQATMPRINISLPRIIPIPFGAERHPALRETQIQ